MDRSFWSLNGIIMLVIKASFLMAQQAPPSINEIYPNQQFDFFSVNYHKGYLFPTNEFISGINSFHRPMENYRSIALEYGFHGKGSSQWHKAFRCPYYGLSLNISDYHNTMEMGTPMALAGFIGFPFLRLKHWSFYTDLQYGITFGWKYWNKQSNPLNIAIGSYINNFIDLGFSAYYPLSSHWQLGLGVSLTHVSNGGMERPNHGLNMWAPFIKIRNNFNGRPDPRLVPKIQNFEPQNEVYIALSGGAHELTEYELNSDVMFPFGNASIAYMRGIKTYLKIGGGIDLGYITSTTSTIDYSYLNPQRFTPHGFNNIALGIFFSPELVIDRLSLVGGIGIYCINERHGNFKKAYQRLGLKYHINEQLFMGFNIRSVNFSLSEFIEWNVGYRIKWR